jgi:hypothetical protein
MQSYKAMKKRTDQNLIMKYTVDMMEHQKDEDAYMMEILDKDRKNAVFFLHSLVGPLKQFVNHMLDRNVG